MKNIILDIVLMTRFEISITILLIALIIMLSYIGYLKLQLSKKKLFLNSILAKIHKIDKNLNKEDILKFLNKLEITDISGLISKDHIFNNDIMNYLFENENETKIFLHYTKEKSVADLIIDEGFKFSESFYKTAENIHNDKIAFVYKHNLRKHFGKYIIIIVISKDIWDYYSKELSRISKSNLYVEHILSKRIKCKNEDTDNLYLFPYQFIKGYIDNETGEIVKNQKFNPKYNSEIFNKNIENQIIS